MQEGRRTKDDAMTRGELIAAVGAAVRERGGDPSRTESKFRCPDPSHHTHGDADPSALWNSQKLTWWCPVGNFGGGYRDLARRLDTGPERARRQGGRRRPASAKLVATYNYPDERGELLYQVCRFEWVGERGERRKDFWQRRPDGKGGWISNLNGVRRVLYRLPELLAADPLVPIYVVEGEQDVETLRSLGLTATTNAGGAGKIELFEMWKALAERPVVIVPDNDAPGRRHAQALATRLHVNAGTVRILELPGLPQKGDVTDWMTAGHTREDLQQLASEAPHWIPPQSDADDGLHSVGNSSEELFNQGRFVPARLGTRLVRECRVLLGHDRRLWRYANGVYRPDGDDWARQRTRELVGDRFRRNQIEEVLAYLRAQLPTLGHEPPPRFINCTNGLLDWETAVLHPHSPDVLSTNQIPVAWHPDALAPRFERFLEEVLPADAIELVEEVVGYSLFPGNPLRKAVMLLGPGGNGKSVLLRLMAALLGQANVASVPLQALSEDRFSAADLFGKLANICGDLDARAIQRTDLFKQVTGGDAIRAQFKFRDAFSFVSYALALFSANEAPRTSDQTDAWFDRWIIIPFSHRFGGTPDDDPHLSEQLAAELEGVLVRAVTALQRLMVRGRFAFPPSVEQARDQYRETLDTVRAFVIEECHLERDGWVDRAELYQRYREWCLGGGRHSLASTNFNLHLTQAYAGKVDLRKRQGRPGWLGLAFGPASDAGDGGDEAPTPTSRADAHAQAYVEVDGEVEIDGDRVPSVPLVPETGSPTPTADGDDGEEECVWRG